MFSGSKAALGNFREGAFLDLSPSDFGGLPIMLPYLVNPGNRSFPPPFNGSSSGVRPTSWGREVRLPLALECILA